MNVADLPEGVYLSAASYGGREVLNSGLVLDGTPNALLELTLRGDAGTIQGVVRNADDEPVANAIVALVPPAARRQNPDATLSAVTDQAGRFVFATVPQGDYDLLAWEDIPAEAYRNVEFIRRFEARAEDLTVAPGSSNIVDLEVLPATY